MSKVKCRTTLTVSSSFNLRRSAFDVLDKTQLLFNAFFISLVDKSRVSQSKLALFRLLGKDVAFESVFPLDFSRTCNFKAFLGAGLGFHFRHDS